MPAVTVTPPAVNVPASGPIPEPYASTYVSQGFLLNAQSPNGEQAFDIIGYDDTTPTAYAYSLRQIQSKDGTNQTYQEMGNYGDDDHNQYLHFGTVPGDAKFLMRFENPPSGVLAWGLFDATPIAQPAAITAPTGGTTVDAQARTAITAILNLLSQAAGGYGLTA